MLAVIYHLRAKWKTIMKSKKSLRRLQTVPLPTKGLPLSVISDKERAVPVNAPLAHVQ